MKQQIVSFLVSFHKKDNSLTGNIISLFCGAIFFLVMLSVCFIRIGLVVETIFPLELNVKWVEYILSALALILGLFFLFWTTFFQWKSGKGTPAPNAPTQLLVVSGPYRLCRNPIELGAIFYYFSIGTLYAGIIVGILCFLFGFIVGSSYHKCIEEKELAIRFGDEYKVYKNKTPFLFPRLSDIRKNTQKE